MTSSLKPRDPFPNGSQACTAAMPKSPIPATLEARGAVVRARRGQAIALTFEGAEAVFVVRAGVFMMHLTTPKGLRQVVALYYPGDVVRTSFGPPASTATLSAVSTGEVLRFRWSNFCALMASDPDVAGYFEDAVANQIARQSLHMAAVGRFDCRQRVASFLLELALRTGGPTPSGSLAFEIPLSRTDMADYLGLNADTLSRTMSHLRASGVLSHPERHRASVRNIEALAALSPAADSLLRLYGTAP